MDSGENIFEIINYKGDLVVFSKKKWLEKKGDHPELCKKAFINCLKKCIVKPDDVWEDFQDKTHKQCYYKKYSATTFAKIILWTSDNPWRVVSAYEIDHIKEINYPILKKLV